MGNKNSSANTNATEEPQQIVATPQMQQQQQMPVKNVRRQNYSNVSYSKPAPVVSNNRSVYDDDDAIAAPELAKGFTSKSLYDLAKGLKFGLKPIQKAFKLNSKTTQTVPAMITLKTLDSTDEGSKKSEDIDMAGRPSVDLICVIDHSGSMSGTKIELVRKTLVSIIDFLNEKDRICLIEFDD